MNFRFRGDSLKVVRDYDGFAKFYTGRYWTDFFILFFYHGLNRNSHRSLFWTKVNTKLMMLRWVKKKQPSIVANPQMGDEAENGMEKAEKDDSWIVGKKSREMFSWGLGHSPRRVAVRFSERVDWMGLLSFRDWRPERGEKRENGSSRKGFYFLSVYFWDFLYTFGLYTIAFLRKILFLKTTLTVLASTFYIVFETAFRKAFARETERNNA